METNRPAAPRRRRGDALKASLVAAGVFAMSAFGAGVAIAAPPAVNCNGVFSGATPNDPISKVADKSTAVPGEVVTYTITWTSTGTATAVIIDCFRVDDGSDDALNALVEVLNVESVVPNVGPAGSTQTLVLSIPIPNDPLLIGHTVYDRAKPTSGSPESRSALVGVQVVAPEPPANEPPTVSCPTMTVDGLDVSLSANAADADGSIVGYHWDFGDGQTADTTTGSTSHSYAADGSYDVSVTVTDDDGDSASAGPCPVTVAAPVIEPPDPPVNVAPTVTCPTMSVDGLSVTFSASGVDPDGSIVGYHWVFGDGQTADTATGSTSHTYAADGSYPVSVTVTDDDGETGSAGPCPAAVAAPVIPDPDPTVNVPPTVACPTMSVNGLSVGFTATGVDADGTIEGYAWDFGDGYVDATADGSTSHVFASGGTYDVYVMVIDDDGADAEAGPCPVTVAAQSGGTAPIDDDDDAPGGALPVGTVVLPKRIALPRTGADARTLFMLAGLLLFAGGVLRVIRPRSVRTVFAGYGSVARMVEDLGLWHRANARRFRIYGTVKM